MTGFEAKYSEAEIVEEFSRLFPHGFAGPDVIAELAPEGWESSPLLAVCHPTLAQIYDEACGIHRNLLALRRPDDSSSPSQAPTLDDVAKDFRESAIDPEREVRELVGKCLWDILSENHDVIAADGRRLDLGSFRASAGFLADFLNRVAETVEYDYLDFYLGTCWIAGRADLTPVYKLIFRRLRARGLDWIYHFPRLYAVDLRPLNEALQSDDMPQWQQYDPSEALAAETEEREQTKRLAALRESLNEAHREAIEDALTRPPPATVIAYEQVYGQYPQGWPPWIE
jgi:hypothetical protein